jgi:hypothetical protein
MLLILVLEESQQAEHDRAGQGCCRQQEHEEGRWQAAGELQHANTP